MLLSYQMCKIRHVINKKQKPWWFVLQISYSHQNDQSYCAYNLPVKIVTVCKRSVLKLEKWRFHVFTKVILWRWRLCYEEVHLWPSHIYFLLKIFWSVLPQSLRRAICSLKVGLCSTQPNVTSLTPSQDNVVKSVGNVLVIQTSHCAILMWEYCTELLKS